MSNEAECRQELSKWFGSAVTADPELMQECLQICSNHNLNGELLYFKWEAYSYNNITTPNIGNSRTIQGLTLDGAKALRAHIAREIARANEKRTAIARARGGAVAYTARAKTGDAPLRSAPGPLPSVTPRNDGAVVAAPLSVKYAGPTQDEISRRTYRYMFEKISTRSEVLDDRIDEFIETVREKFEVDELGDPSSVTEELVTVIGRLCLDSEADAAASSSRLSSTTLVLEASRMGGSGERIPLKFEPDFTIQGVPHSSTGKSLFPGEILVLRGRNGGIGWFMVKEVLTLPIVPSPSKSPPWGLSVCIASGPYTPESTLDFSAFTSIVDEAKISRPAALILLGPFIDAAHTSIKTGKLPSTPLAIFQQAFLNPLLSLLQQKPDTLILLVPHVRDILSSHSAFPQGVGEGDFGNLPSSIRVLPNPCLFSLNDVRFGVSTVDVLYHLKNQQYIQRPQQPPPQASDGNPPPPQDAMANLCRHILEQRSFYPLFPVPLDLSPDVNLDVSHSEFLAIVETPDIMVLPTILRQFSKTVEDTIVINPSVFGKSRTIANLHIPASGDQESKICKVAQVELKRLG